MAPSRYKGAYGGRGSGKSHFFGELLVETCQAERGTSAVCIREAQRSLARGRTRTALSVLAAVMRNPKTPPAARIAAANAILDRGWGKPPQAIHNGVDGALELIHRIERIIVDPENPDSSDL